MSEEDRRYYAKHAVKIQARARVKRAAGEYVKYDQSRSPRTGYTKEWFLLKKYGITLDQWNDMFEKQGRCCAACKCSIPNRVGKRAGWSTDHDHVTGIVRGILCHRCNLALGWLGDQVDEVRTRSSLLLSYLERAKMNACPIDQNGSDRNPPLVHYIIVRADLPHGVQVAQTVHAAGETAASGDSARHAERSGEAHAVVPVRDGDGQASRVHLRSHGSRSPA